MKYLPIIIGIIIGLIFVFFPTSTETIFTGPNCELGNYCPDVLSKREEITNWGIPFNSITELEDAGLPYSIQEIKTLPTIANFLIGYLVGWLPSHIIISKYVKPRNSNKPHTNLIKF